MALAGKDPGPTALIVIFTRVFPSTTRARLASYVPLYPQSLVDTQYIFEARTIITVTSNFVFIHSILLPIRSLT